MTTIHPKTAGAAIGSALGVLLLAIVQTLHGVHLPQGVTDAIAAFLPIVGAYLAPAPDTPAAAATAPAAVAVVPPPVSLAPDLRAQVAAVRAELDKIDPPRHA